MIYALLKYIDIYLLAVNYIMPLVTQTTQHTVLTILVNNDPEIISKEEFLGYFKLRGFQIMTLRICL